ncbi:MAG: sugar ABC transporter substrate-binding protein [Anaerolineae bacterium]|nr:sugar ABC transporter substrate-binding protein [Anaerolineae bacterium]
MSHYRLSARRGAMLAFALLLIVVALGGAARTLAQEPVTLTYGWWSGTPEANEQHLAWLAEFEAAHPTIKIEAELLPWGAYWEKVQTTLAGGNAYDIIGLTSGLTAQYMANDLLVDLSTLDGYADVAARVNPDVLSIFNWDGKQYVMPVGVAARSMGYRTDLFEAAGVELFDPTEPLPFDEFVARVKPLTVFNDDGSVKQYAWNPNASEPWHMFVANRGGSFFDSYVNPTRVTINTPEGIAGLRDLLTLVEEQIVPPWAEWEDNQWGEGTVVSLQTGTVAMADIGPWSFATIVGENLPVANTVYPVAEAGQTSLLYSGANGFAIPNTSAHVAEAWEFLKWMTTKEAQLAYAKWSDIPANTEAFSEVFTTLEPQALVGATEAQLAGFRPNLLTDNTDLDTTLKQIMRDMTEGRLTPEEAAAQMEAQGNALLGAE